MRPGMRIPARRHIGGRSHKRCERSTPVISRVAPSTQDRLLGVEGLRAVAAAAVVVYHTGQVTSREGELGSGPIAILLTPFALGVTLFFVLSGFLLYRPFAAALIQGRSLPSFRRYYRNRALRILPAYWFILGVTVFVLGVAVTGFDSPNLVTGDLREPVTLMRDALFIQNYSPDSMGTGILPAWSLAVEVVFYLVLPLLALAAVSVLRGSSSPRRRRRAAWLPVAAMVVIGVGGKLVASFVVPGAITAFNSSWHSVIQFSFFAYADVFAWGMAIAVVKASMDEGHVALPAQRSRILVQSAALVGILLSAIVLPAESRDWFVLIIPLPFAIILGAVVLPQHKSDGRMAPLPIRLLTSRPLVAAGVISYSIFLWNHPLLYWLLDHGFVSYGPVGFLTVLAMVSALCAALSILTYRFVELPALRLKNASVASLAFLRPLRHALAAGRREP
jgi:peptidoglycan/LPS O-acetylase OafA/YrhL